MGGESLMVIWMKDFTVTNKINRDSVSVVAAGAFANSSVGAVVW